MTNKNSLLYWYPKIKDLEIPQPKTEIVLIDEKEKESAYNGMMPISLTEKVRRVCGGNLGFPVFIRTDLASGKHQWKDSCFYDGSTELWKNLLHIIEFNTCADILGLPFGAMIIREFIPMDTGFTAFNGDMPVNPERRYFVQDGKLLCHHPYWIKEALAHSYKKPSIENWEEVSDKLNFESEDEVKLLSDYAKQVASIFESFWSVDFCKAKDGRWVLIDMALGGESWHPEDCNPGQNCPGAGL